MTIRTKANLRGLRDIRTRTGSVDRTDVPYMAYMKISCLEMEKARRNQERVSAHERIGSIDRRLEQIEAEKENLLAHFAGRPSKRTGRSSGGLRDFEQPNSGDAKKGFKIRY